MKIEGERVYLTPDEALPLLDKSYHTFVEVGPILMGCDGSLEEIQDLFSEAVFIEISGPGAREMGHGIVARKKNNNDVFIMTNEKKLKAFEKSIGIKHEN